MEDRPTGAEAADPHHSHALVVNLYPDQPADPTSWSSRDLGSPSVLFRRGLRGWVAHLERHAVLRAPSPEALAADVYGEYGVLAVLHNDPHRDAAALATA